MGTTRFYARQFEGNGLCPVGEAALPALRAAAVAGQVPAPEVCYLTDLESQHCAKVLRLRAGDLIEVTDGEGALYVAALEEVDVKGCSARIEKVLAQPGDGARPRVRVVMAPTKQTDRLEWFLEKATEMGTAAFGFVRTHRTERDRLPLERLEKIAVSAMKQSLQRYKPQVEPLCTWREFMTAEQAAGASAAAIHAEVVPAEAVGDAAPSAASASSVEPLRCIAYCGEQYPRIELAVLLRQAQDRLKACGLTVLIGPEGDFTPEEVAEAVQAGYTPVLLGPNRLRAETAALYAACAAQQALL